MSEQKIFAPQNIWDESHKQLSSNLDGLINYDDAITKWIYKYIKPVNNEESFFEIGCYPGRYMVHFGKLGYTLNGIDQSSELNAEFTTWLKNKSLKVDKIEQGNIFELNTTLKYDLVASFGFIEHFSNFAELIDLHFELAKPNSIIVIAVPDFSNPVQYMLHGLLDKKLMNIHNLKAMKPTAWRNTLKKYKHEIVFDGYFGGFNFWYGEQKRNWFQKLLIKAISTLNRNLFSKTTKSSSLYSPFYGMIIIKK